MRYPHFAARVASAAALALILQGPAAFAQRGGRGGGGMQRGGGGGMERGGGGGMQRGGGGGGMERGGGGGMQRGGGGGMERGGGGFSGGMPQHGSPASMGPYGHASGSQRPPGAQQRPGSYPGARPEGGAGTRPGTGAGRPGVGASGVGGPDSGVGVRPGMGAGRPGMGGPDSGVGVRPGMGAGAPGMAGDRYGTRYVHNDVAVAQADAVRVDAARYPVYGPAMYGRYPNAWNAGNLVAGSYYANPGYAAMSGMLGMGATPMPYDYGGNVVAQPTAVFVNGDSAGTPQEYAQQAGQIAASGAAPADPNAAAQPAQDDWLPIGVFAMVEGDQTNSNDIFQLAVNKQGQIRGNYHNLQTDSVDSVSGAVDPKTQRVAWTIGGDQTPVYEAGVSNLLQDHAPMLVHTPDGQQKQFTLVRLADPGAPGGGPSGASPAGGR